MKKAMSVMSMIVVVISIIIVIATFLTSYRFVYINEAFSGYFPLQLAIAATMAIWGCKFWVIKKGIKRYVYSGICFILSLTSVFFITNLVR